METKQKLFVLSLHLVSSDDRSTYCCTTAEYMPARPSSILLASAEKITARTHLHSVAVLTHHMPDENLSKNHARRA